MADHTHDLLRSIIEETHGPKGWFFELVTDHAGDSTMVITIDGYDNYDFNTPFRISHLSPVPKATFNEASWRRWIFERCRAVMNHELGEQVCFGEDRATAVHPYAPCHGPGEDPYVVHEYRPEADALTTQTGALRPGPM